jgi:hypothetical protein
MGGEGSRCYGRRMAERPQTTREAVAQGAVSLVLLSAVLLLINRYLRDLAWAESLWRTVQFAVPFVIVFTALQVLIGRRQRGG